MFVLGFLYSKSTPIVQQKKCEKTNMSNDCVFRQILTNTSTLKIVHSKSPVHGHDPKFVFHHRYKTVPSVYNKNTQKKSLQYTIKTHLSGPPMPKFEANMNFIQPSPPSSMKQCNKSATVKFHIELLLIPQSGSNLAVVRHHTSMPAMYVLTLNSS